MKRRDLLLAFIFLIVAWQLAAWLVHRPILPSPLQVGRVFITELGSGGLLGHFAVSLWRVLASTILAIVLAAPAGLISIPSRRLSSSRWFCSFSGWGTCLRSSLSS